MPLFVSIVGIYVAALMEQLHHQTARLLADVQAGLVRAEQATSEQVHLVESEVQSLIDQCISNCERLDILVAKEPAQRRSHSKMKLDSLKYDVQHFQASLRQLQHRRSQREEEAREREALLRTSFRPNDSTTLLMDHSLQHHSQLTEATSRVDELIANGQMVLGSIKEQRLTLKGAHRRMLDFVSTLGLSNTVMRYIEKRSSQDKLIFCGLTVGSLLLMFFIWFYWGR